MHCHKGVVTMLFQEKFMVSTFEQMQFDLEEATSIHKLFAEAKSPKSSHPKVGKKVSV